MSVTSRLSVIRPVFVFLALIGCAASHAIPAQAESARAAIIAPGRVVRLGNVLSLGTAASGIVTDLPIRDGMHVERGQLLVRIECDYLEKELDAKKANFAAVEAVLARVVHGPRPEELAVAAAEVEAANTREEQAVAALKRMVPDGPTTSEAQIDQAKRDLRVAAAQVEQARAKLSLLRAGSRTEDISEARFSRDAAEAIVGEVSARVNQCSVRAPRAGIVLGTKVTLGQFISAAAPQTLLEMIDNDRRGVQADVDERDVSRICLKKNAIVTAERFPGAQVDVVTGGIGEPLMAGPRPERGIRHVELASTNDSLNWPVGLRVTVKFKACPVE
jgi:multidrug resistance efflux pump